MKEQSLREENTITDIDGNVYHTVLIGAQCWLKENLKTTRYNTGESIPLITDRVEWVNADFGAMCYHSNDVANVEKYGVLYNAYSVLTGILCPEGWHVPSSTEWDILTDYLGGTDIVGHPMRTDYDWYDNYNGKNESGFSVLPAGIRNSTLVMDDYYDIGKCTGFWSSTEESTEKYDYVRSRVFYYYDMFLRNYTDDHHHGHSVRCLKDEN